MTRLLGVRGLIFRFAAWIMYLPLLKAPPQRYTQPQSQRLAGWGGGMEVLLGKMQPTRETEEWVEL